MLPNNKNIIMAAQQCVGLIEGKEVVVVPTRTVPQGISAMLVLDPEADGQQGDLGVGALLLEDGQSLVGLLLADILAVEVFSAKM